MKCLSCSEINHSWMVYIIVEACPPLSKFTIISTPILFTVRILPTIGIIYEYLTSEEVSSINFGFFFSLKVITNAVKIIIVFISIIITATYYPVVIDIIINTTICYPRTYTRFRNFFKPVIKVINTVDNNLIFKLFID